MAQREVEALLLASLVYVGSTGCGGADPALALTIGADLADPAGRACVELLQASDAARLRAHTTRGSARAAFERGEVDLYIGSAAELLRCARHGGRTPRVLAAWVSARPPRLLARPEIEALVELKGRSIGLDPDQDGLHVLGRVLAGVELQLADVRIVWCERERYAELLQEGHVQAVLCVGDAELSGELRDLTPPQLEDRSFELLIGSTELEQRRARDLRRLLQQLGSDDFAADELAALQRTVADLERALVEVGELIGPTGSSDALGAARSIVRGTAASPSPTPSPSASPSSSGR